MSHKHHKCECTHESVKFCKTCKLVHCLDCNQEWQTRWTYNYAPFLGGLNTPYITTTAGTVQKASALVSSNSNILNDGHTVTVSTTPCGHKS